MGNKYISLQLSLPVDTIDYHVNKENSSLFPDWNKDWKDRIYYDKLVIKNLTANISIKFHNTDYTSLPITTTDSPAIIEPFNYRDVFITNEDTITAEFDITFFSSLEISAPPLKPTNLTAIVINSNTINLSFLDNSFVDDYYYIERSIVSATSDFIELDNFKVYGNKNQYKVKERTYSDTTCSPSTQYWYRIRAYNSIGGFSPYSNVITATTVA